MGRNGSRQGMPAILQRTGYELRLSIGWITLLPLISFAAGMVVINHMAGCQVPARVEGVVTWFEYVAPLAGALALVPVLLREGQWRTIDLVRSRTTLWLFSTVRSVLSIGLTLVAGVALAAALRGLYAPVPLLELTLLFALDLWVLTTWGLLAAHLLGESTGYAAIAVAWLVLTTASYVAPTAAWVQMIGLEPNPFPVDGATFVHNRLILLAAGILLFVAQVTAASQMTGDAPD